MSDTAKDTRIFVLYNAKASLLGKLSYGYKKLCAPADDSPCAACDLTHGGLKLQESEEWKGTKAQIPATVEQRHIDELTPEVGGIMEFRIQVSYTDADLASRLCEDQAAPIPSSPGTEDRWAITAPSHGTRPRYGI